MTKYIRFSKKIINAIKKYTNLTVKQIKEHLQWGKGPTIEIKQLGGKTLGEFDYKNPNNLYLDIDLVNDLEKTQPRSKLADAYSFLMGVTILHEYVHFGAYPDEFGEPKDRGDLFEADVYGQSVWRSNAKIILGKKKK